MAVQNSLSSAFVRLNAGEGCAFAVQAVQYFMSIERARHIGHHAFMLTGAETPSLYEGDKPT